MERGPGRVRSAAADAVIALIAIVGVSILSRMAGLNATTVALVLHSTVVILAAMRNLAAGLTAAITATISLSFFLHPMGTWRITEPENWLALVSFLVASTVIGRLLILARDQAIAAEKERRHVATLYRLGVDLLAASDRDNRPGSTLELALAAVPESRGGVVKRLGQSVEVAVWHGAPPDQRLLRECEQCLTDGTARSGFAASDRFSITRIDADEAFVLIAPASNATAVDSVSALVALALRHQRAVLNAARVDALRESEIVRTSLIRAVSHDLKTPLTAMMLELDTLDRDLDDPAATRRRLASLKEDAENLHHRIQSLLAMARIDAGTYRLRLEPVATAELLGTAARHLAIIAANRAVVLDVAEGCPEVDVDITLATELLTNLVDNAHRASPPGEEIRLVARPGEPGRVVLEVVDSGPGLDLADARWSRGLPVPLDELPRRGLGLEIARTFANAVGATVTLRREQGTIAAVDLPASVTEDATDGA